MNPTTVYTTRDPFLTFVRSTLIMTLEFTDLKFSNQEVFSPFSPVSIVST